MTEKLDYAHRKVFHSRFWAWAPRPRLPAKVASACAILGLLLLIPALWMMHDFKFIRDYNPHWWQWVTPIAILLALLLALLGTIPSRQGFQRETVVMSLIGLVLSSGIAAYAIVTPGAIVCGESADRIRCASNLRSLGQALSVYASFHGGEYPDDFATLIATTEVGPDCLVCSMSIDEVASRKNVVAEIRSGGHCSYTYLGKGLSSTQPSTVVLAYETSSRNHDGMINILYADGHVVFASPNVIQQTQAGAATRPTTR